ncbi:MAG TPA: hypothetical protein VG845_05840 [Dehalococcoidia bacterium]|jgi:hypothetical protein|nr:hypothetical protein [Dehalococcoidia bacterium]
MNPRSKVLVAIVGGVLALAVVSATLAATLVADDDDEGTPASAVVTAPTPTTRPPAETSTALDELSPSLRQRVEALPERLREQIRRAIEEGRLALSAVEDLLRQYENRNPAVRVGQVIEADDAHVTLEVYTTGERVTVAIDDDTVLRRALDDIEGSELKRDELVLVLSMDGGATAFSVTAFGVSPL